MVRPLAPDLREQARLDRANQIDASALDERGVADFIWGECDPRVESSIWCTL